MSEPFSGVISIVACRAAAPATSGVATAGELPSPIVGVDAPAVSESTEEGPLGLELDCSEGAQLATLTRVSPATRGRKIRCDRRGVIETSPQKI
jgi:hypothetical protein